MLQVRVENLIIDVCNFPDFLEMARHDPVEQVMGVIDAGIAEALRTADSYIAAQLTQPPRLVVSQTDRGIHLIQYKLY